MLAVHKEIKHENDNFRKLASYIKDLKKGESGEISGEKLLLSWHDGCMSDNFQVALKEIELTQLQNTRTKIEKSYHLVVSFHPEDEARLTPEIFQEIELKIAEALGFSGHQRVCGVHKNTKNIHMHIAYNKINPKNFNITTPYKDHYKLQDVCRFIENKYGFKADYGTEKSTDIAHMPTRARTLEAQTGQESFFTYVVSKKMVVEDALLASKTWKDFQEKLELIGIMATPKGNGMVFKDLGGDHAIKASSVDRRFSFSKIQLKLGCFTETENPSKLSEGTGQAKLLNGQAPEIELEKLTADQVFLNETRAKKETIIDALNRSTTWGEFRSKLTKLGLIVRPRGNGIVFQDQRGQLKVKASDIDRNLSLASIEKVLGAVDTDKDADHYKARPLNVDALKDPLYQEFLREITIRREALASVQAKEKEIYQKNNTKWKKMREQAYEKRLTLKLRNELLSELKSMEEAELLKNRLKLNEQRKAIRQERPFTNWTSFLRHQATDGNENALEILRAKNNSSVANYTPLQEAKYDRVSKELDITAEAVKKREHIAKDNDINQATKNCLISITKMEEAIKKDALRNPSEFISTNFNYNIDNKGTIIYNFKEIEGTIKDTGKQLYFTFNDERCREIAKQYANLKWGKVEVTDNLIVPSRSQTKQSQNYFSR